MGEQPHSERTKWTRNRVGRLGYLIGSCWDAERIAQDPEIKTSLNNVHRQAQRFGLSFREADRFGLRLPVNARMAYDAAAGKRNMTREAFIRALLITAAATPYLIDNIMDDGE